MRPKIKLFLYKNAYLYVSFKGRNVSNNIFNNLFKKIYIKISYNIKVQFIGFIPKLILFSFKNYSFLVFYII